MFVSYQRFSKSDLDIECSVCIDLEQYLTNVAKSMRCMAICDRVAAVESY